MLIIKTTVTVLRQILTLTLQPMKCIKITKLLDTKPNQFQYFTAKVDYEKIKSTKTQPHNKYMTTHQKIDDQATHQTAIIYFTKSRFYLAELPILPKANLIFKRLTLNTSIITPHH
jgi:hypothetical protein